MNASDEIRLRETDADRILQDLSERQYVQPHQPLGRTLLSSCAALGFCPGAADTALAWLQLDPARAVGRLRRTELIQLARSIHRFWRQSLAAQQSHPQPA